MATDDEIKQSWKRLGASGKEADAAVQLYRQAEREGRLAGISALEAELSSDAAIQSALDTFGWGRRNKTSLITMRALLREIVRVAREKSAR
ncbi:Uncharacterised protein [uncultured archaeon]|nr:Uncharacterised protein [uncultured archaeon]